MTGATGAIERGIRRLPNGALEIRVHVKRDPLTGQLRQVSRTTRKGIAEARRIRSRLQAEAGEGKHGGPPVSFGALLDEWLIYCTNRSLAPSTIAEYRRKVTKVIAPALGRNRLSKLSAHHLDTWYGQLQSAGVSPRTVGHYHRIISAALRQAERRGWVDKSVARLVQPPRVPLTPMTVPPPERVQALIELAASSRAPEMATVITVAALTGLRRGELCGLRWSDVDWRGMSIMVERSVWQTSAGWGAKEPKSHQVRPLMLGKSTIGVLAGRKRRVDHLCHATGVALAPDAYIFGPDVDGTRPAMPSRLTQAFRRLCEQMEDRAAKADPPRKESWPYRLHDLRHYTATELFRTGHSARTVADRLGYADPALTLRVYTANTEDQARAAAAELEAGLLPSRAFRNRTSSVRERARFSIPTPAWERGSGRPSQALGFALLNTRDRSPIRWR
jgi:integrase